VSFTADDAQIRRDNCGDCKAPCVEHQGGLIDHADPCAACPRRVWHAWGTCSDGLRPEVLPARTESAHVMLTPQLPRQARAYIAAGLMVTTSERHGRRDACAVCLHKRPTEHRGLYRCAHRSCGCGGGDELRMVMPSSVCKAGNWPVRAQS